MYQAAILEIEETADLPSYNLTMVEGERGVKQEKAFQIYRNRISLFLKSMGFEADDHRITEIITNEFQEWRFRESGLNYTLIYVPRVGELSRIRIGSLSI
jgi:hypothetical protein